MTVIVSKTDVGDMAAVGTVLVTRSLCFGAWILKQMDFAKVISNSDHLSVVGSHQSIDVCSIRSFWPDTKDLKA